MEFHRAARDQCPIGIIAVAINNDNDIPHSGIVYTNNSGGIVFCDLLLEGKLRVRKLPNHYYWTTAKLDPIDALQIAAFVDLIVQRANAPVRYSFIYPDGFDAVGRILNGAGFTCTTFVSAIFDHFQFHIVDLATWRVRPIQDAKFRAQVIKLAADNGLHHAAAQLKEEPAYFRLKPWELFGSATHSRYPVRFCQAKKLAKIVTKLVRKYA
jgi:hypothetical protein